MNHSNIPRTVAHLLALVCATFWSGLVLTAAIAPLALA